jgi:hypothetical protein
MAEDDEMHSAMMAVLWQPPNRPPEPGPNQLNDYMFIGGYDEANDIPALTRLGITHVLNCAAYTTAPDDLNPYPQFSGVTRYRQFHADDAHDYEILKLHFDAAKELIDEAKSSGGRCLVHCAIGSNRSGAICAAYLMQVERMNLLSAVQLLKERRGRVLSNNGFRRQLISFAREHGVLGSVEVDGV